MLSILLHDIYVRDPSESGFAGAAAARYKLAFQEFELVLAALDRAWHGRPLLATAPDVCGRRGFALTVDDGGVSYTTILADRLEARGWRGHAFISTGMIGQSAFLNRSQIRDLDRRGHLIGSHSATHPTRFSACSRERMVQEWRRSRSTLEDLLGHEVRAASVPGGYFSKTVALAAREAGLHVLFTSEPWIGGRVICDCMVAGRFTVRPGRRPSSLAGLVRGSLAARCREWTAWNIKKLVKPVLGPAYPRLGAWIANVHAQGGHR